MLIISIFISTNVWRGIMRGTIVGLGMQKKVVIGNIMCNWVLNFGLMWLLCFHWNFNLRGIWISKLVSENINNLYYFYLVENSDWNEISQKVMARLENYKKQQDQK